MRTMKTRCWLQGRRVGTMTTTMSRIIRVRVRVHLLCPWKNESKCTMMQVTFLEILRLQKMRRRMNKVQGKKNLLTPKWSTSKRDPTKKMMMKATVTMTPTLALISSMMNPLRRFHQITTWRMEGRFQCLIHPIFWQSNPATLFRQTTKMCCETPDNQSS